MSGDSFGLIILPLAVAALPFILGGLAVQGTVKAISAAANAADKYEQKQRKKRDVIKESGAVNKIGSFRADIYREMTEQTRLNREASDEMMKQLEAQRQSMMKAARENDAAGYQEYVKALGKSRKETMREIGARQELFNRSYRKKIAESMGNVTKTINERFASYVDEIGDLRNNITAREQKAQEIASSYISEAKSLINTLINDFEGKKFSRRQLALLTEQLNHSVSLYNKGQYEGAIAGAKDTALGTLEEIYEADVKKQEWDNYYKLALVLSAELREYLKEQETVTAKTKEYAEKTSGKQIEEEIIGVSISDYSEKNAQGESKYDALLKYTDGIYRTLRSDETPELTTEQLKRYVEIINNELYPESASCISKSIINMNNAFSRQNISEDIIDFFEEHNFMFNGYAYDNDRHDKALHIGLENSATGEELIVSLSPSLMADGDIQTRVDLKQIKGDEANEERKAYYRKSVEEIVMENNPYAKVDIACDNKTKNKLSADTETKKKLKR